MKSVILLAAFLCAFCFQGNSQVKNFKDLYQKYENDAEVKCLKVNQLANFLLSLSIPEAENETVKRFMNNCSEVSLLMSKGQKGKDLIRDAAAFVKRSKLEELTTIKEGNNNVQVYAESKEKEILQLFVVVQSDVNVVCLQLSGSFSTDLLKEIAKAG